MKIGIIGCGLIGKKRAQATLENGDVVVAVFDLNLSQGKALAQSCGAENLSSAKAVIESKVDAVIIATTHNALSELAIASMRAGRHVLVEKPAGLNLEEVQAIENAADKYDRIVKVGYSYRFHPAITKAKALIDDGCLGPIMFLRGRHGHGGRVGYNLEWRCKPELSGGGELIDQGSHLIDLANWFAGELKLDYAATATYFWDMPVEDNCFLALRGSSGEMAWLHASWSEWKNVFSFEIYGRNGKLTIDGLGGSYGVERLTWHKMLPQMGPPETSIWEYPGPDISWLQEHREFADAVKEGRRPLGDIKNCVAVWRIIDQIYKQQQF